MPMPNERQELRKPRIDAPTFLIHWVVAITCTVSLLTGLRIAGDDPNGWLAPLAQTISIQGDVVRWHILASIVLTFGALSYAAFMIRGRLSSRLKLDGAAGDRSGKWRSINVALYWAAFAFILLLAATGSLLYFASASVNYPLMTTIHQAGAWFLLIYAFFHLIAHFMAGGIQRILKVLRPTPAYGSALAVALPIASVGTAAVLVIDETTEKRLEIAKTDELPVLDGKPDDTVWAEADAVDIATHRGMNLPNGQASVSVKALHDGDDLYMLFEWPDSTRSQKHLPLVKTGAGWKVTQTEFGIQDEDAYYEDKFGVMLAKSGQLAGAGASHLGPKPLAGKPAPSGGRGLHYTTDGSVVDVWHWKSVRSGTPEMSQIDDNFFGPPMESKGKGRYTAGYSKDDKSAGGFSMNWEGYSDEIVTPKRLPADPAILEPFQNVDLDPDEGDALPLALNLKDTVPYSPEADTYPVGTIMPAVLIDGPFVGDRGDVTAVAKWQNGWWCMEVKRKLDTGSKHDVAVTPDEPVYMWVAVFDHTQTRHSQHLRPVELVLN